VSVSAKAPYETSVGAPASGPAAWARERSFLFVAVLALFLTLLPAANANGRHLAASDDRRNARALSVPRSSRPATEVAKLKE
jgi:hypothetical protein